MVIGLVSGYWEGWLDLGLQPVMVALMAIPGLVLALAIVSGLKSRTTNGMLAIVVVIIPGNSRIVRRAGLSAKQNPYVQAVQVLGCRHLHIIASHILPDVTATVLITADRGVLAGCRLQSGEVAEWVT
jgi:ABC-type dipeptide/oligopeptide/nickel transport system permease subunit